MTTKEKLLFASPLLMLFLPLLFRARDSETSFREVMVQLAGPNAIDCNATRGSGSLVSTIKTGKPFFSSNRQYEPTDSTYFWSGMVRTPEGKLFDLCWQEAPWYSPTPGKLKWIARVKNLKFLPAIDGFSRDGGNILTAAEQTQLLQKAGGRN